MNKANVIATCRQLLNEKVELLENAISEATQSRDTATKSSAGDKHETARAMVQLEIEKLGGQLSQAQVMLRGIDQIDATQELTTASVGALVVTTKGTFFLGPGLGKIEIADETLFCVSMSSPIGQLMMGKTVGEEFQFQSSMTEITGIQ